MIIKKLLSTDSNNWAALIARVALGITVLPHGAQKLLGWFGGNGFSGTMGYFTEVLGIPAFVAFMVILIEFFGALFLIFGFVTRVSALGILGLFIGVASTNIQNGFFMNWTGTQSGEGIEYFILLFGLALSLLIVGAGKASVDSALIKNN